MQIEMTPTGDQAQAPALPSKKEQREAAKLAKKIERANKKQAQRDQLARTNAMKTEPDSFYERAIEFTHRADKVINLVLGYLLAIASVLGFMDVLSNGQVLGHIPWAFYIWLLIMGLGVDFQILLVIGRVPDLARMVSHGAAKTLLIGFNIVFLVFLAYVSILIGAVFTQHVDVAGSTVAQAMSMLGINANSFVYERATLATALLVLMAIDRTMERWRMQIAAGGRQEQPIQHVQVSEVEEQATPAPTVQPVQSSDLAQIITAMQDMNAQNLAAMQSINQETLNRFSMVTVELVRETIERTAATVALPGASQPALPEARQSVEVEQEAVADALQDENEGMEVLDITVRGEQKNDVQGEHEARDYGALIEAMYQRNHEITVTEIVDEVGCSRSTALKWLKRVKPVNA